VSRRTLLAVDTRRPRLDRYAFALALVVVAWPAIGFAADGNGAAAIMSAMCFAGLLAGRLVGLPGWVLLSVAFGLAAVLWLLWIDSPVGWRKTSALAHTIGGALAGWALVEGLTRRIGKGRAMALLAVSAVVALAVVWELGEWLADRLFDTALRPKKRDSVEDILFGVAGGVLGVAIASVVATWRRGGCPYVHRES
jgi:hypothetical protein